jgi:5'-3' exonuclease
MDAALLVVDGDSILFRAFYALPDTIRDGRGRPVNALLGTINLVLREVQAHAPRAVVVCFGAEAADYRVELFGGYHAQRAEIPPELSAQFQEADDFLGAFGWSVASDASLEADDLLGAYARREAQSGGRALLMTGDRDMFQCAGERVTVLYVRTGRAGPEHVGPDQVRRRYGVAPELVPDFIALRGDPSDGIPGAKGVGEKTAAELLRRHGSLEAALAGALREGRPRLRAALIDQRDELLAFKEIASLRDVDVALPPSRPTDYASGSRAARKLGMNRLAERLERLAAG